MPDNKPDITSLFEPKSVAIVGASHEPSKIGYKILENVIRGGYSGKVYPVNPKGGEILGYRVYKSILEIEDAIDLACISIPAPFVFEAVQQCASRGVKYLAIITSGFSEVGNISEERRIVEFARAHGMRVLGPNIFGIYSANASLNATFGPAQIRKGNVGIITQSGALGIAMMGKTQSENIGLSAIISIGNKSDIDETDLLEYLGSEQNTRVILMYIEGVKNGEKLVDALKKITKTKTVIVIKSGRSRRGAIAAASHTGSLAGEDNVFSDIMRQCGVIRCETISEALNLSKTVPELALPSGENTVIITNGGGVGVLAADASEKYGVNLYSDYPKLKSLFQDCVPQFGSTKNPVDLTGQATIQNYRDALKKALEADEISSVICVACETALFDVEGYADLIKNSFDQYRHKKPIVFSLFGGKKADECIAILRKDGIPVFHDVYDAVFCLGGLYRQLGNLKKPQSAEREVMVDKARIQEIIEIARRDGRRFLLSAEAHAILEAAGIPAPESRIARNLEEAVAFAEEIGYPVVLKVVSKQIIHKSDVGGVALDILNKEEVIDAYQSIINSCRQHMPDAHIEGVEICEMVEPGIEVIVGARIDPSFGPVVMFGLGGIYVEVMKDVAFRAAPVTPGEAVEMISEVKGYPLLLGVRGEKKKDINSIVDCILKMGMIINECREISDIEINPLVVYDDGEGARAVDARIILSNKEVKK
ncbi:MAG: acetate--CoA ligase family protein [Thermoplasmata archaeon]|nr:acetate--CoA ligase family protein [Thermoplasmata archaeon]